MLAVIFLPQMGSISSLVSAEDLPHHHSIAMTSGLMWTGVMLNGLIAGSYGVIFACILWMGKRLGSIPDLKAYSRLGVSFGLFVLICGMTRVMAILGVWWPNYPVTAALRAICAAAAIPTAIMFVQATPKLVSNIRSFLDALAKTRREQEDEAANYRGQIEAINRSQMMIEFGMDGMILRANDNYLRVFGLTQEDVEGKDHSIFVTEAYRQSDAYEEFWKMLRDGEFHVGLFRRVDKEGNEVWIEASYNPILSVDGIPLKVVKFATNATERVKVESDLKDAESRTRAILDSVLDTIITLDGKGKILSINPAVLQVFEYRPDEVIGQNVDMLMHDPERSGHEALLAGYEETGKQQPIGCGHELEGRAKSGRVFPMELTVTEVYFKNRRLFLWVIRDITERKRQEEALRKSQEMLDRTGRLAAVGGWEIDIATNEVKWSAETCRLMGVAAGYTPTLEGGVSFYTAEAQPVIAAAIEKAIAESSGFEIDLPMIRADGRPIWCRVTASVELADGRALRLVGAIQDVTARIAAQEELQEANTRVALATESSGIGLWSWDVPRNIMSADSWMHRLWGLSARDEAEPMYERMMNRLHPEDRERARREVQECLDGNHLYKAVFRVVWDDGSVHHISASGQVERAADGSPLRMVGANWDITELVEANEKSLEAMELAKDSNRTKSDFLANMSHEIRTPMNAILGMTYLALRAAPTPRQHGYLTKIGNAAQSLLSIMNDILDFSKIEAGKLELERISFSLAEVIRNLVDIVGQRAQQKGIALVFTVANGAPGYLVGDPLRLGQILINLVNNAIKFTEKGEIVVKVVADNVTADSARLSISVSDTGIGMSPEQVSNLFQSFNQGDTSFTRKYGGTGLGLAISRQLCELMDGKISVESELGQGSTFCFTANFGVAANALALTMPGEEEGAERQKKSVLIVDDSENAREVLILMLRGSGFAARAVSSGEEAMSALARASQMNDPIDLVLLDWRLPGVDGIETARRIKTHPNLVQIPAILMISAFEREEVMSGISNPAVDGFLIKPVQQDVLMSTIAEIFGESKRSKPVLRQVAKPSPATLTGRQILLVEDNEINRDLASELLTDLGVEVEIAVNGREGVERVLAGSYDLVLMDIQMPVMDGLTATKLIRADERFHHLPIVAMTAHAMSGDRERSLYAGMNDHLTKPISPEMLTEMLIRWIPASSKQAAKTKPAIEAVEATPVTPAPVLPIKPLIAAGEIPETLPPFDIQAALARANGKPKLLRKMMLGLRKQFAETDDELRRLIAEEKIEEANRLAHSLKGVAATLEAKELSVAAAQVEYALRDRKMDGLTELIDVLGGLLKPAIAAAASLEDDSADQAGTGSGSGGGLVGRIEIVPKAAEEKSLELVESVQVAPSGAQPQVLPSPVRRGRPLLLIVDDDCLNIDLLSETFGEEYDVLSAVDSASALELAWAALPDIILLDVLMPKIGGYEICRRLKEQHRTSNIPVIFITSLGNVANEIEGLKAGALDYVTKPVNRAAVRARVQNHVRLKLAQDELDRRTEIDPLTGLANRRRFDEMLDYEYARHARSGTEFSLIMMDIDQLKNMEESVGPTESEECLRKVGEALGGVVVRATDLAARFAGEEFVFLLPETSLTGALVIAEKIRKTVNELQLPQAALGIPHITASLGVISARHLPGRSLTNLIAQADEQLYLAKAGGRNRISAANAA